MSPHHYDVTKMKTIKRTHWVTDEDKFITDPIAAGFKEEDCGPDMLCGPNSTYCERVAKFRACFVAIDGPFKKMADTLEGALTWKTVHGCDGEGGVSADGIVRFTGIEYRIQGKKHWLSMPASQINQMSLT